MKSSFRILAACLAASLALVSCEKESTTKTDNGGEAKDGVRTITVSFSTSTRSALADDGVTPHFTNGDEIMLANEAGTTQKVTVSVSDNTATASTTLKGKLTAVYPADAYSATEPYYTVNSSQDGTFAKANICTATIPDEPDPSAEFETQVAIFCFQDSEGYTAKKLLVISTGESLIADEGADTKTITIGDGLKAVEGVYMAVKPGVKISELVVGAGEGRRYLGRKADGTANDGDPEVKINTKYDVNVPVTKGHEYVELIISGSTYKWATMNVGASSPTEYGLYFAWGETTGHSSETDGENAFTFGTGSKGFAWENCPHTNGVYSNQNKKVFTKYVPSAKGTTYWSGTGNADDKTTLESSDDAATVNWGSGWRMPTKDEFVALKSLSSKDWTTDYNGTGVNGCVFSDGTNRVFVPAAGYGSGSKLDEAGSVGYYRSSSLDTDNPHYAYILKFDSSNVSSNYIYRYRGYSVRPLSE